MSVEIIWEPDGVVRRFYGILTAEDLFKSIETVHTDPLFAEIAYSINIFIDVTTLAVSSSDVLGSVLKTVKDNLSDKKIINTAFVADNDEIRQFISIFTDKRYIPHNTRIVSSVEEARQWVTSIPKIAVT